MRWFWVILFGAVNLCAQTKAPVEYAKSAGPAKVEALKQEWKDTKRDRVVPVKFYLPAKGDKLPVIVFSHGMGGSRDGYEYVGRHWASHGYVVVHLQHAGSDESVWKGAKKPLDAMRKAAREPVHSLNRAGDVKFALDQLTTVNKDDAKLKGRLDLDRVGLAGHSFGARTTLTAVGQTFLQPKGKISAPEPRVKAAIAMSPAPQAGKVDHKKAFASVKVPVFHMTGTNDDGVGITDLKPVERRVPYDNIPAKDQYLMIFKDGDHMVYSGRARLKEDKKDARFRDLIRMSTTAFWDAHLKGDKKAKEWLTKSLKSALGKEGTFESK